MNIVQSVADEKGILRSNRITHGWWQRFIQRQKDSSLRRGDNTAHIRMDAMNKDTMKQYFNLLENTLKEHNLLDSP